MADTTWRQYLTNIGHAVLNRKEYFDSGPATTSTSTNTSTTTTVADSIAKQSLAIVILVIMIYVIIIILMMYGAARLSYCYNTYYGADSGTALLFSILSAIFSGLYYPFYAIFLNPLCSLQRAVGGRR
jgi:hypothetical protein